MKKTTLLGIMVIIILITGCGASNTAESKPLVATEIEVKNITTSEKEKNSEVLPELSEITENSFYEFYENIKYTPKDGDNVSYYSYDGYEINRFDNFVAIAPAGKETQILSGTDFVLTENTIWFVNDERKIASFNYRDFEYSEEVKGNPFEYRKSEQYKIFKSADLSSKHASEIVTWAQYDKYVKVTGPIAFAGDGGTILFEDNRVEFLTKMGISENCYDRIDFPFSFKEVGLASWYNQFTYVFVLTNNTIGTITVKKQTSLDYNIIAEGNEERSLFYCNDENNIDRISVDNGYIIYYENGKLRGSNGKLHFDFDDLPYKEIWIGDSYGVGKGFSDCCFLAIYEYTDNANIENMIKKSKIKY